MNQTKSIKDKNKRNNIGSQEHCERIIKLFSSLVDKKAFYETAESILIQIDNPEDLATCARIVEQRGTRQHILQSKILVKNRWIDQYFRKRSKR